MNKVKSNNHNIKVETNNHTNKAESSNFTEKYKSIMQPHEGWGRATATRRRSRAATTKKHYFLMPPVPVRKKIQYTLKLKS